jgi:membrane protein implicated in regulation of membrane protease activity
MLVLGLLLIILTIALTAGAVYDGGDEATVEILGQSLSTTVAGVFFAGAVTMLLFLVGVWALMASMGRARRKRADRKDAKNRQKQSVQALEEERAALRAENERLSERLASTGSTGGAAGGTAAGGAGAAGAAAATHDRDHDGHTDHTDHTGHDHTGPDESRGGARGLMDKVTGRDRHDTASTHDTTAVHDTSATHGSSGSTTGSNDRVIDSSSDRSSTDLTSHEEANSGRHRDSI